MVVEYCVGGGEALVSGSVKPGRARVLISAVHRAREAGGDLQLCGVRPAVRRVFSITGVDAVIDIRD